MRRCIDEILVYTDCDKMKEWNRLNELVIKGTVINESLGPVCPTFAANKMILPRFIIIKRWGSD